MDKLAGLPLLNNHGAYNYSGPGYFFLASVVEKLRGMPLAQAYKKYIFNPAGMKNSCSIEEKEVAISKLASGYTPDLYGYRNGRYRDPSTMAGAGDVVTTVGDFHLYDRALRSNLLLSPSQKAKLETPKIESEGYSLTFTRFFSPERKDTATLKFFTGQLQGYTALAYHVLEDDKLIVTFYNVDNPQVWEIGDKLFRILYGVKVKLPGKSIVQFLRNHSRGDINKATAAFISLPEKEKQQFEKNSGELNRIGYDYLNQGKVDDAIAIFKLNVTLFPEIGDLYDSLGEGYYKKGDHRSALINYSKALELDPKNTNAQNMIAELTKLLNK
jgi:tetratricopeptide (TPR) repeat protein